VFCKECYNTSSYDLALLVIVTLNQINIKKNKIDKNNFKKIMWEDTVAIHSVL
jgi:hypothetical protein